MPTQTSNAPEIPCFQEISGTFLYQSRKGLRTGLRDGAVIRAAVPPCPALGGDGFFTEHDRRGKKACGLIPAAFFRTRCCRPALCSGNLRRSRDCKCAAHPAGTGQGHGGDPPGPKTGRMALCPHFRPRRREAGKPSHPVHGADRVPCLSPLERRRIYILSVSAGLLGGGAGLAGEPRPAPVLYRLPVDSAGVSRFADCGYCTWVSAEKTAECGYTRREYLETMEEHCIRSHDSCFADWLRYNR